MNPFINKAANSLPGYSQVLSDDVSQWKTWSKGWYVFDDCRFARIPYFLHTGFYQARGQQVRAFANSLKSGEGVFVLSPQTGRRDITLGKRIGESLWQRVIRARGRRSDYDKQMTRSEVMYVSRFPQADLRGLEIHHLNRGRTHKLWRQQIEARLAGARLRGVESLDNLLLTLDDRPLNLMALTSGEHFLIHLLEGTLYFGNLAEDASEAGEESVRSELFEKVRNCHPRIFTNINPNQGLLPSGVVRYDNRGLRFLTTVNRRYVVAHAISDRILSNASKYGLRSA